jgi:hypothetical protein
MKTKSPNHRLARRVLGDDFISPEELRAAFGLTYDEEQLLELERTIPGRATLEWLRCNRYYLVAGPSRTASLYQIHARRRGLKSGFWLLEQHKEPFVHLDKVICRWLMLRKYPSLRFASKTWQDQERLLRDPEVIANVAEQVWGMIAYKAARNEFLLFREEVRTSSICSRGHHVCVGGFGPRGMSVTYSDDNARLSYIGVALSRRQAVNPDPH